MLTLKHAKYIFFEYIFSPHHNDGKVICGYKCTLLVKNVSLRHKQKTT